MTHAQVVFLVIGCVAAFAVSGCAPRRLNYTVEHVNRMSQDMIDADLTHTDGSPYVAVAPGALKAGGGSFGHSAILQEIPEQALLKWTDGAGVSKRRVLRLRDAVDGKLDLTDGQGQIRIYFNEDGTISVAIIRGRYENEHVIREYTQDEISRPE